VISQGKPTALFMSVKVMGCSQALIVARGRRLEVGERMARRRRERS